MPSRYSDVMAELGFRSIDSPPGVDEGAVEDFETRLGVALPEDYREFLLDYGKVAATELAFPDPDRPGKWGAGVEVFYGLQPGGSYDLADEWDGMRDRLPPGVLPVTDGTGGIVCLGISEADRGRVFWWAAESCRAPREKWFYPIAPSFDGFLRSLRVVPV